MKRTFRLVAFLAPFLAVASVAQEQKPVSPFLLKITVEDVTSGQAITNGQTLTSLDTVQVTLATAPGAKSNCAGQLVVTQLGPPGSTPVQIAQLFPVFLGPAFDGNSATFQALTVFVLPSGTQDYKVSATCNAASNGTFAFAHFEFHVDTNEL